MGKKQPVFLAAGLLVAAVIVTCDSVPLTAPGGSNVWAQANPPFVIANGGTAVVTALITKPNGMLVANGTNVYFFTNLGRIDESVQTRDGMAHANFVSDSRSGNATITVWSGGAASAAPSPSPSPSPGASPAPPAPATGTGTGSATVGIAIGSARPAKIIVTARPDRITSPRRSAITANVFDSFGNPVQNVPVVFTITKVTGGLGGLEETLASGGVPQYTDSNGQAFDTLITRAPVDETQKQVTVTASVPVGTTTDGTVVVYIN